MVFEFPELQGIMGGYYAAHSGEDPQVAQAVKEHYRPSFAGDDLPSSDVGAVVAVVSHWILLRNNTVMARCPSAINLAVNLDV